MNKQTLCVSSPKGAHPSLFPLQMKLFAAEIESPPQPPRIQTDPNEELALELIENIRHPKSAAIALFKIEAPQPAPSELTFEMAGRDA